MEIVRHRLASFSQESTRYCNYSKDEFNNELTFIIPCWFEETYAELINFVNRYPDNGVPCAGVRSWIHAMEDAEERYNALIDLGWSPQEVRSILPNSLKTEIVVTANLREWRTIFTQRTASGAHPQMKELMVPLLAELKEKLPIIFDDL